MDLTRFDRVANYDEILSSILSGGMYSFLQFCSRIHTARSDVSLIAEPA